VVRRRQAPAGGTREQAEAAPDPSPDRSRSRRGPGQEVGFRARLSGKESSRGAEAAPGWLQVLGGSRGAAAAGLENSWRRLGGWVWMGGQQAPTEPRRVNSEVSRWGQASSNNYQTVCGCKDTMKSFFNGRAWNYLELLKIESGVLLRLEKETKCTWEGQPLLEKVSTFN